MLKDAGMIADPLRSELRTLIKEQQWAGARDVLENVHPSDIAEVLVRIPQSQGVQLFRALAVSVSAEVFAHLPHERQEAFIRALGSEQIGAVLSKMSPDDEARVLDGLTPDVNRSALASMSPDELKAVRELLMYPPHSTGRYMTPRFVSIHMDMTAREARRARPSQRSTNGNSQRSLRARRPWQVH